MNGVETDTKDRPQARRQIRKAECQQVRATCQKTPKSEKKMKENKNKSKNKNKNCSKKTETHADHVSVFPDV